MQQLAGEVPVVEGLRSSRCPRSTAAGAAARRGAAPGSWPPRSCRRPARPPGRAGGPGAGRGTWRRRALVGQVPQLGQPDERDRRRAGRPRGGGPAGLGASTRGSGDGSGREHPGQVLAVVGLGRQVGRRVGAVGGVLARGADRLVGAVGPGEGLLGGGGAHRHRAHVGEPDAGLGDRAVLPAHERGHPDDGPGLGDPAELLVGVPPAVGSLGIRTSTSTSSGASAVSR